MFWGLVLEPGKKYSQVVDTSFHISKAVLEVKDNDNSPVSFIIEYDNREFISCVLQKNRKIQSNLDLNFEKGTKISFFISGNSSIHLTGYLVNQEEEQDLSDDDDGDEEEEEEEESEQETPRNTERVKRKMVPKAKEGTSKKAKKDLSLLSTDNSLMMDDDDDDDSDEEISYDQDFSDLYGSGDSEDSDSDDEQQEDSDDDSDEDSEDDTKDVKKGHPPTPFAKKTDKKTPQQKPGKSDSPKDKTKTPKGTPKVNNLNTPQMKTPNVVNGTPEQSSKKKKKKKNKEAGLNSSVATPGAKATTQNVASTPSTPAPVKKTLEGGVIVEDTKVGNGPVAKAGSAVSVYYTGRLKQNNKQFDSVTKGNGFKFRLGQNEVIKGWDIGVSGMKVGGKRKIIVPSSLGYGAKGAPPHIPPNSSLVFEVELLKIK